MDYEDLTEYTYYHAKGTGKVNVGWVSPAPGVASMRVALRDVLPILYLCIYSKKNMMRGWHVCSGCGLGAREIPMVTFGGHTFFVGTAEIWLNLGDVCYAAPDMVIHYILSHGYCPPSQFLTAARLVYLRDVPIWSRLVFEARFWGWVALKGR